ncbi:MAG TPA: hypothetical protein ENG54_03370 [Thermofilum sp.]|nr:hypothetical protein [Thermofilum sp.]
MKTSVTIIKPNPKIKKLYWIYFALIVIFSVISWSLPLALLIPASMPYLTIFAWIPTLAIAIFFAAWLGKYYDSIEYVIEPEKLIARRGVWWKVESSVPLTKVNNVKWKQGPLQRFLGLASLEFHTAAMGTPIPEISFSHLSAEDADRIRKEILARLGKTFAGEQEENVVKVLKELLDEAKTIRKLLQTKS